MSSRIGAQLYTLREYLKTPTDIANTLNKVSEMGYEAVQVSAVGPIDPAELRRICDSEGLKIVATHEDFYSLRDKTQAIIDKHKLWGCDQVAIGGLPGEYRNADGWSRFAKEASEVAAKLKEGGLTFSYHNHSFELEKFGDRTGLQILYEDSDPEFFKAELDTYWIQHGGASPVVWMLKLPARVPLLHCKDMTMKGSTQLMAEVGEGNLDWEGILDAAPAAGVEWFLVEQDTCQRCPFESLAISLKNLKTMGIE
ncbi:MAG TPA: sugar phosphate isomerase/epimerase [Candidatus Brocadiia bacterium]|nr:sugar phosphate isomerase/epimerase [Candidatus Brocadiia bacterium]